MNKRILKLLTTIFNILVAFCVGYFFGEEGVMGLLGGMLIIILMILVEKVK